MISIKEKINCCGCSACIIKCPESCIDLVPDNEGFKYPKVNKRKCINCNLCIDVCPIIQKKSNYNESENEISNNFKKVFFACKSKNERIRHLSSSGGIFSLIAEYVLDKEGIIFGAGFNEDLILEHSYITNKKDLNKFRGSKYLQSNINNSYKDVKNYLNQNKLVLFTGTPCQISGLKRFLNKDYENLISVDIVCHGVSSPKVFDKYLKFKKSEQKSDILNISFRDKKEGWRKFSFTIDFKNGYHFSETLSKNTYMRGFLRELYQRPACHHCNFKIDSYESDITLGDYWGIHMFHPNLDDNKGTSFISINSKKGEIILKEIENLMDMEKTRLEDAYKKNRCIVKTVKPHRNRSTFFKYIDIYPIDVLIKLSLQKKKFTFKNHLFLLKETFKKIFH
jgi:coenzyme F420-reducing hydrogenase beta subunit